MNNSAAATATAIVRQVVTAIRVVRGQVQYPLIGPRFGELPRQRQTFRFVINQYPNSIPPSWKQEDSKCSLVGQE